MWFLNNKVVLTNDNLAKRNWHGCTNCCFRDSDETVEHLFIPCPFASIVWRMIYFTYNIPPPTNISNMFGNWLNGVDKTDKARIRIGVSALCWSIWTCQNNLCLINMWVLIFCRLSVCLCIGYSYGPPSPGGSAEAYGYWMQLATDGHT
jgi:hypothetical protein